MCWRVKYCNKCGDPVSDNEKFCNKCGNPLVENNINNNTNNSNFNKDNKGCSLVLLNTEKGCKLFEAIKDRLNTIPANLEDCMQPNMIHPSQIHPQRDLFEKDYVCRGFKYVMCKYGDLGWKMQLRYKIRKIKKYIIAKIK